MIAHNVLLSIDLIADSTKNFASYCVKGIKANKKRIKEHLDNSLMLVTALNTKIGYDKSSEIAKNAHKNGTTLKEEALKLKYLTEEEFNEWINPKKMCSN